MGKREETRLLDYYGWSSRHNFTYNMLNEWSCMDEIDTLIKEADELIKGHSDVTPLYYQSQKEKIDELNNNYISYIRYIDDLYMDIYDVDHAFFTDIKNNAVEQLSNVKQNKYAVQEGELADKYGFDITLTDFIVGQRTYHGHGTYRLEITELQDFSEMLKTSYEELAEEAEISTTDYILKMFENGEYDHSKYHPVRDFISGLLDTATLGILPMVELMAGYDFITGEELSSQEATNKGIEAVMGLVAIALIPFTSGGSVGLKAVGKQILVESATGVVSYTIYEAGEAMDMPAGITFALSIAGGGLTYKALDGGIPHINIRKNNVIKSIDKFDDYSLEVKEIMTSWSEADISAFNKLLPEERSIYIKAIQNEGKITPELQGIVIKNGGYLDGLEFRIKSPSSVFEKIYIRPESTPILDMNDIVRYTEIQDAERLVETTQKTILDLEVKGYEVIKLKNTWLDDMNPYNGINAQVKSPDGQIFELQFHTPESFALKNSEEMHGLYELQRVLDVNDSEYINIMDKMFELSDVLSKPKDIETLKNIN